MGAGALRVDPTRRYYEEHADAYHERTIGIDMAALRAELTDRLAAGARVLDLGCGSGRDLAAFRAAGLACAGLDLSAALLALSRATAPGCPLVRGALTDLPFRDGAFDGLWVCASLLHVPADAAPGAAREMHRVLARGGFAIVSLKEGEGAREDGTGRSFVHYTVGSAAGLFDSAGFPAVAITVSGMWLTVIARKL